MPRAANQYNGSLIRPALCPNSNKAAVLNLEKLIEGRPSICADTVFGGWVALKWYLTNLKYVIMITVLKVKLFR